jgi:hypothetical protein
MAVDEETGMAKADMRRLLMRSKQDPVYCALAAAKDPSVALLLLDRIKDARTLERFLQKQFPDAHSPRFGIAFVDVDTNPKLAKFLINKPVSGMAKKLVRTLKGTGFTKVQIVLEDGTPVEMFDEDPAELPQTLHAPAAAEPAASVAVLADLKHDLAALIERVKTVLDSQRKADLATLASAANTNLKAGNLTEAASCVARLRGSLDADSGSAATETVPSPRVMETAISQIGPQQELARLIPLILSLGDRDLKPILAKQASQAGLLIKSNDSIGAEAAVEQLRQSLADHAEGLPHPDLAPAACRTALSAWQQARRDVDREIGVLSRKFSATRHPVALSLSDRGLPALRKAMFAPVTAALSGFARSNASTEAAARSNCVAAIATLRDMLEELPDFPVLERNPLGLPVTIRPVLHKSLALLEQELAKPESSISLA